MREKLTRTLAGLIVVAFAWAAYSDISNFTGFPAWHDWVMVAGMVVLMVAFAVYAVAGTGPAHRVLSILSVPNRITEGVLRRVITEEDHEAIGLTKPKDENLKTQKLAKLVALKEKPMKQALLIQLFVVAIALPAQAQNGKRADEIDRRAAAVNDKVIAWRRDIHANPELGNREVRTSKIVADHLRSLGIEVRTGVAHTGVIGVLKGGRPGPVVALRADMDALPVTEKTNLPFASKIRSTYNGQDVGVMHACGHDTHVAMLMGVAEVVSGMRNELAGTVVFIFQPAEEGPPRGEEGGAALMLKEGAFRNPRPEAVFGLHVFAGIPARQITYRPGGQLASADELRIVVHGRQTHGAKPWGGVDPIVTASQVVLALQTIVSRQLDLTNAPAIVTIGMINGGVRNNIIPDSVVLVGTLRALDPAMREDIHARVRNIAEHVAASAGATATVTIIDGYPVTMNDAALTAWAAPIIEQVVGKGKAYVGPPVLGAEDFSYFAQQAPGFFFMLGATPDTADMKSAASNHSPLFIVDETTLPVGVRTLAHLAVNYLSRK